MKRIIQIFHITVPAVCRHYILNKVICADTEKSAVFCKRFRHDCARRGFYHNSEEHVPAIIFPLTIKFGLYFFNTIVSTFFIMVFQLGIGILAAYGFSKGEFKGKNTLFLVVLGALMIPIQVTFMPIYVMVAKLGWINSFPGLIVPNLVSAYFIFMLRQTFMSVDNSYLEAGKVDGMGRIGTIFYVLCPMCKPTLITVSIITFINGWNSYFWPKMVTNNNSRRTLAVGINYIRQTFAGLEVSNYNEIMAAAVLAIVPIVVLFLVLQKYIMTGLSKASMK